MEDSSEERDEVADTVTSNPFTMAFNSKKFASIKRFSTLSAGVKRMP